MQKFKYESRNDRKAVRRDDEVRFALEKMLELYELGYDITKMGEDGEPFEAELETDHYIFTIEAK